MAGRLRQLLPRRGSGEIAVDLGTANTVVFVRGEGIVLFEPSVIAINELTDEILAVGEEARSMIGRTPATIRATRPLRHGVITDFDVTEQMLRHFMRRAISGRFRHPRVVLCVPSGITDVERRAVEEATLAAGASQASLIEEPMAAAIGADLPIADAAGNLIVDIGGGTTEVAVISLGGIVVDRSVPIGGYEMDEAIMDYAKRERGLLIGQERAEEVKIEIGSALEETRDGAAVSEVAGRDRLSGLLRRVALRAEEVQRALEPPVERIVQAVRDTLERTPPELSADVVNRGIFLAGGGSLLRGIDARLGAETALPVHMVAEPLTCVAVGAGRSLEEIETLVRTGRVGGPSPFEWRT
jgi:rod shape-determining protein MreB and related proteins